MEKELIVELYQILVGTLIFLFVVMGLLLLFLRRKSFTEEEIDKQVKAVVGNNSPAEPMEKPVEAATNSGSKPKSALRWIEKAVGPQLPPKKKKKSYRSTNKSFGRSNKYF